VTGSDDYLVISGGSPTDKASIPLSTRKGNYIRNERLREASPEILRSMLEMDRGFTSARLRSATQTYNCMGMVFAARRTAIASDLLDWILEEDGYSLVNNDHEVEIGDLVVYRNGGHPEHVGVVVGIEQDILRGSIEFDIMSKWGKHPEYIHPLVEVPARFGTETEFWTDRKDAT
jgi:hypothetical protein